MTTHVDTIIIGGGQGGIGLGAGLGRFGGSTRGRAPLFVESKGQTIAVDGGMTIRHT